MSQVRCVDHNLTKVRLGLFPSGIPAEPVLHLMSDLTTSTFCQTGGHRLLACVYRNVLLLGSAVCRCSHVLIH